jgi:ABC-2 type transport system permease protein/bacitracin transport system permease protein
LLNIIYCELLKLKKSYIIPVAVIGGMFMSILFGLASLVFKENMQTFEQYSSNLEILNILVLYTILFSLIAGFVFSREFTDRTSSVIYACSISRIKIFIGKLITIDMLISIF